jgi:N,N'-diacetyllegionaminate synthase
MSRVFIIAEAGVNHNGSIDLAKKLIDVAAAAGADAVKFQLFKAENLLTKNAQKAAYQIKNTEDLNETQFEMIKKLELDQAAHRELIAYARSKAIIFLSSPFDEESIETLVALGLDIFKVPSGEITNLPYLRRLGRLNKNIILSTGMSTLDEVKRALALLVDAGTAQDKITVLHCNTEYPTPFVDVNLRAMMEIKNACGVAVGYSDHTLGIEVPIAAVALGASVIEKHITLDKNMLGPDHRASIDPDELTKMVAAIRNIEQALGVPIKTFTASEAKNRTIVRKSIVAKKMIKVGEVFTEENIAVKRPGLGLSPMLWDDVLGQVAKKTYQEDEFI